MSIGLAVVLALAIGGILAIVLDHLQEMEKIRLKAGGQTDKEAAKQLQSLAAQVEQLRQAHLEHVLQVDNHLQRIEQRLAALESRFDEVHASLR